MKTRKISTQSLQSDRLSPNVVDDDLLVQDDAESIGEGTRDVNDVMIWLFQEWEETDLIISVKKVQTPRNPKTPTTAAICRGSK